MSKPQAQRAPSAAGELTSPGVPEGVYQVALALVAAGGVVLLAYLASMSSEPLGLTLLAILATLGVFFVFGVIARLVRVGPEDWTAEIVARIVAASPHGVQICDPLGEPLFSNTAFRALAGTDQFGEPRSLDEAFADQPEAAEALFRLARASERGEDHSEELTVTQAGARRVLRVSVEMLPAPQALRRASRLVLWRTSDITDLRGHEAEALADLKTELSFYDEVPVGLCIATADGAISFVNARLAGWLGLSGRHGPLRLSDIVTEGNAAVLLALARQPGVPHRLDLDLVREDGRLWPGALIVTARAGRLAIAVTERADEMTSGGLKPAEARLSKFFQSAPFGIALIGSDGRVQQSNSAFGRLLLDPAAARAANTVDLLGADDKDARASAEIALASAFAGKASIAPFDITVGQNREFTRRVYMTPLARSGGAREAAVVYVIDASEQKALEHKFAQSQKMEAVGTLAGGIAHDFNNVLTAIIGFSDLLLQSQKPGDPGYMHVASIKSSANRAAGLVRQLLAFSRRQTLQPQILQLGDVLTDLSVLLNRLLGEKIELKINAGRDLWTVKADRTQLEQVVINLTANARDAMAAGGRLTVRTRNVTERESARLENTGMARGEYVLIEVEDTGTGMTPDVLAKIFEPFFTTKAVGKGTGLGLAMVYGIVKQTGGYIYPDSEPGKGTTFRVYLPRHVAEPEEEEEAQAAQAARKETPRDLTGAGRVLLVEDEDAVRTFAVEALKRQGYDVLQACDGVEALEILEANGHKVDIVVSDVIMPEMDGPTLMREVRKTSPDLKFIFVSGYPDDAFKGQLDAGADFAFLPKPYSLAQIAAKVKEQLGR